MLRVRQCPRLSFPSTCPPKRKQSERDDIRSRRASVSFNLSLSRKKAAGHRRVLVDSSVTNWQLLSFAGSCHVSKLKRVSSSEGTMLKPDRRVERSASQDQLRHPVQRTYLSLYPQRNTRRRRRRARQVERFVQQQQQQQAARTRVR